MWGLVKTALLLAPALACGNPLHSDPHRAGQEHPLIDVDAELAALKFLNFQSAELRRMIMEKEVRVAEALGRRPHDLWDGHVDLVDCDTVTCMATNIYRKVHAAATAFHGLMPHCQIVIEESEEGDFDVWGNKSHDHPGPPHGGNHSRGNHTRPGHGRPGHGGNHTNGNHTRPHPRPPGKKPHHPPPPPPPPHHPPDGSHPCPPPPHPPKKHHFPFLQGVMFGFALFALTSALRRRQRRRRGDDTTTCAERRAAFFRRWHNPEGCILRRMLRRGRAEETFPDAADEKLALMQHYARPDKSVDAQADDRASFRVAAALVGEMAVVDHADVPPN